jgi:hypothetical protein
MVVTVWNMHLSAQKGKLVRGTHLRYLLLSTVTGTFVLAEVPRYTEASLSYESSVEDAEGGRSP